MALILDTGPLYASLDRADADHGRCRSLIEDTDELRVVPAVVLPELDYLTDQRLGVGPMLAFLRDVEDGAYRIADLEDDDYPRVREIMDSFADSDVGFVDAAVLTLVERLGEPKVATLDHRHFAMVRLRHVEALTLVPA